VSDEVAQRVRVLADRYELGEAIGRGGMSDVYVGMDRRLGRRVAIKLLRPNLAEDASFRARFRREAHDAAKMAHPTIVRIFDAGEEAVPGPDGVEQLVPFIVMEHVDGRLLRDIIADGPVPQAEAARIVEQILIALEYSHRAGVIHRDIKPGNVMVTRNGQVKVMDFGIARAISESAATIAETSHIVGTAQYFSPEQARGEAVDARTDLYSTGVVLYELLTGRPPFQGDNPVAVAYQHLNVEPVHPRTINPAVSPAMEAVVLHALAKDPGRRYQSAAEFRTELQTAASGQIPVRATPRPDDFNATLFGTPSAAEQATLRQLSTEVDDRALRTTNRPPVLWIWAGIVVLAGIVAAVGYWIVTLQPADLTEDLVVDVPDVIGLHYDEAAEELEAAGLVPQRVDEMSETVESGLVLKTEPARDTSVQRGQVVEVVVSSGQPLQAIPDVSRMDEASARATLEGAGFTIGSVSSTTSGDIPGGTVISTDPGPGTQVAGGTPINLVLSNGLVTIPDVRGMPLADAHSTLTGLGLNVKTVIVPSCSGGAVQSQSTMGDQPQHSNVEIAACVP